MFPLCFTNFSRFPGYFMTFSVVLQGFMTFSFSFKDFSWLHLVSQYFSWHFFWLYVSLCNLMNLSHSFYEVWLFIYLVFSSFLSVSENFSWPFLIFSGPFPVFSLPFSFPVIFMISSQDLGLSCSFPSCLIDLQVAAKLSGFVHKRKRTVRVTGVWSL